MSKDIMYHSTSIKNRDKIIQYGLLTDMKGGFTEAGSWAQKIYKKNPIFLSKDKNRFKTKESIVFAVDVKNIKLFPDIPSLIDFGAYIDENIDGDIIIYWKDGEVPSEFYNIFGNDCEFLADELLTDENIINAAINLTRTVAVLRDIPPENIEEIIETKIAKRSNFLNKIASIYYGKAGAGILLVCKDDETCLLLKRSRYVEQPGTWGISGGAISKEEYFYDSKKESGEEGLVKDDFLSGALRETNEELFSNGGFDINSVNKNLIGETEFKDGSFTYKTFIFEIDLDTKREITKNIKLNWENDSAKWFGTGSLPSNLHFGVEFTKKSLSEQDINIFRNKDDELDWLFVILNGIKEKSTNTVWVEIFDNFNKLNRFKYDESLYDFREKQNKEVYDFLLNTSKILKNAGLEKEARKVFHESTNFNLKIKSDQKKTLNKQKKSEISEHEGYLYHGTNFANALSVLSSGEFLPMGTFTRLSLTSYLPVSGKFGDIVFVFDAKKLQRKGAKKMSYSDEKTSSYLSKINPEIDENYIKNPWITDLYKYEKEWIMPLPYKFSKEDLVKIIIFKSRDDDSAKTFFDYILENNDKFSNIDVEIMAYPSYGQNRPGQSKKESINDSEFFTIKDIKKELGESYSNILKSIDLHKSIYEKNKKENIDLPYLAQYDVIYSFLLRFKRQLQDMLSGMKKYDVESFDRMYNLVDVEEKIKSLNDLINRFTSNIKELISSNRYNDMVYIYGKNWPVLFKPVLDFIYKNFNTEDLNYNQTIETDSIPASINNASRVISNRVNQKSDELISSKTLIEIVLDYFNKSSFSRNETLDEKVRTKLIENLNIFRDIDKLKKDIENYIDENSEEKTKHWDKNEILSKFSGSFLLHKLSDLYKLASPSKVKDEEFAKHIWSFVDSKYLHEISDERLKNIISLYNEEYTGDDIIKYKYHYAENEKTKCKLLIIARELAKKLNQELKLDDLDVTKEYIENLSCN